MELAFVNTKCSLGLAKPSKAESNPWRDNFGLRCRCGERNRITLTHIEAEHGIYSALCGLICLVPLAEQMLPMKVHPTDALDGLERLLRNMNRAKLALTRCATPLNLQRAVLQAIWILPCVSGCNLVW